MRLGVVVLMLLISLLSANKETKFAKVNGVEVSYECKLYKPSKEMHMGFWANGCPYTSKAQLRVGILKKTDHYEQLPKCSPPTPPFPQPLPNKLGITLFDSVPEGFELIDENNTLEEEYGYKGYPNGSYAYTNIDNLRGYCRSMVASYNWTADEYRALVKGRYFTRTYKKTCFKEDAPFSPLASNEEVVFEYDKDNDRSKECADIKGKVQYAYLTCKDKYRCVITSNTCPIEGNTNIASFVNQKDNSIHQDIDLLDSKFTLYHNSNYIDVNSSIAKGWSVSPLVFYKERKLYMSNGNFYSIPNENNQTNPLHIKRNGFIYTFDKNLLHVSTKDMKSDIVLYTFSYDENKTLQSIQDRFGKKTTFKKDKNTLTITTPKGKEFICLLDENENIVSILFPDKKSVEYIYKNNLITQKIDRNKNLYTYKYKNSLISSVFDPMDALWKFQTGKFIKPENETINYTHIYKDGILTSVKSDNSLDLTKTENLKKNTTTYKQCGNYKSIVYHESKDEYKNKKLPKRIIKTTPNGLTQKTEFKNEYIKEDGKLVKEVQTTIINDKIYKNTTDYKKHSKTSITPGGKTTTIFLDKTNTLPTRIQEPKRYDTLFFYDDEGKLVRTSKGLRVQSYEYDEFGNLSFTLMFPSLRKSEFSYDVMNRLIKQKFTDGREAHFSYDANGNLLQVTTTKSNNHSFTYNKVDKQSSYTTPKQDTTSFIYDKQRRLVSITKPSSKSIKNIYTKSKLVSVITDTDVHSYTYECDNISSISSKDERIDFSYDGILPTSIIFKGTLNKAVNFTYNNDFLPNSIEYAGSKEIYTYDKDNLLISSGDSILLRDKLSGDLIGIKDKNYEISFAYNPFGELVSKTSSPYSLNITRIGDKITSKSEYIKDEDKLIGQLSSYIYTYDKRGRLKTATKDLIRKESYEYDDNSNLIQITTNNKTIKATYNNNDQLVSLGNTAYTYDKDGYLQTRTKEGKTTTYTYDIFGNLKKVQEDNKTIEYIYSPNNQIIAKKINGNIKEKYLWHNLRLLAIYDESSNLKSRFYYHEDRVPYKMIHLGKTYYLYYNQIDSLRVITNKQGTIIKEIEYDSYGNIIKDTNKSFKTHFNYAGGFYDEDTNLIRFGKRDYSPEQRRWSAIDPILFDGGDLNLYGYVLSDPIQFVDPEGLSPFDKINEKLIKKTYCKAQKSKGSSGCDVVLDMSHKMCLALGSPAVLRCQKLYRKYWQDCMQNRLDCKNEDECK